MKRLITVFTIVGALTASAVGLAQAQEQPSAVTADPGYQVRLGLANQLVEVNGGRKQMEAMMSSVVSIQMKTVAASLPETQRPLIDKILAKQQKMLSNMYPSIINLSVNAYASTFTEQELRDLLTFQESPSGQAMILKMPALNARVMGELMPLILQQMPQMMKTVLVEVCDEQHCTAEQRQTIAAAMARSLPGQIRAAQPPAPAS